MDFFPKIAIIGGGPAGLTLANILQKNSIPFSLFEHDASPNERNQGGTLDLHPKAGQAAFREAGLWDVFIQHARPESDVLKVVKQDGVVLWDGNMSQPPVQKYVPSTGNRPCKIKGYPSPESGWKERAL